MTIISARKIAIYALIIAFFAAGSITAPFTTTTDAKSAVATAIAANGPVGGFLAMPQVDPAPINTAITNLKAVQAQFASNTDPKVIAALKDLTDSCITPWTDLLAKIPNMSDEKTKFATAQTTLTSAINALDSSAALAVIAKAKTDATTAVSSTTAAITAAVNALAAARKAFETIISDPLLTSSGATAPVMPWSGTGSTATVPATATSSATAVASTATATAPATAETTTQATVTITNPGPSATPAASTAVETSTPAAAPASATNTASTTAAS